MVAVTEDKAEALAFIEKIANKVKKDTEAFILTKVIQADIQLNHYNNREKVKVRNSTQTTIIRKPKLVSNINLQIICFLQIHVSHLFTNCIGSLQKEC